MQSEGNSRFQFVTHREFIALAACVAILFGGFMLAGAQGPRTTSSPEVRFADVSPKGLAIVPASCPSNPHSSGECSPRCAVQYYCSGSNLYRQEANCSNTFVQACAYGCASGACNPACVPIYYCVGNDVYYGDTRYGYCPNNYQETCSEPYSRGCSNGACLPPAPPTGSIDADPDLIRSGKTSVITWTSDHAASCTVTEDNPDIEDSWTGPSGEYVTSKLYRKTKYTLTCEGYPNSSPPSLTDSATVNIVPVFEEL